MASFYHNANTYFEARNGPGGSTVVYCKQFGDMVSDDICTLRRDLLTRKGSTCKACIMSIALVRDAGLKDVSRAR